jgi:hypothetical protein
MLVVMGIMVIMMSISAVGYIGMRRGAEIRGAAASVKSTLMLARQFAVTKRERIILKFSDVSMDVVIASNGKTFKTIQLPRGVEFVAPTPSQLEFLPSGAAGSGGTSTIKVEERQDIVPETAKRQHRTIKVWRLTGVSKELVE